MKKIWLSVVGVLLLVVVAGCANTLVHLSKKGFEEPDSPRVEETACQHYLFYFIPTHWQYMRGEWQPQNYKWLTDRSTEAMIKLRTRGITADPEDTDIIHYSYWWFFGYSSCEKMVVHLKPPLTKMDMSCEEECSDIDFIKLLNLSSNSASNKNLMDNCISSCKGDKTFYDCLNKNKKDKEGTLKCIPF